VDEESHASSKSAAPTPKKKPYVKPAFRYEKVFETQALACGKIVGTGGQCQQVPKTS
jgi:hypothetical protein